MSKIYNFVIIAFITVAVGMCHYSYVVSCDGFAVFDKCRNYWE